MVIGWWTATESIDWLENSWHLLVSADMTYAIIVVVSWCRPQSLASIIVQFRALYYVCLITFLLAVYGLHTMTTYATKISVDTGHADICEGITWATDQTVRRYRLRSQKCTNYTIHEFYSAKSYIKNRPTVH